MGAKVMNYVICLLIIIGALLIFGYEFYTLVMLRQIHKRFEKIKHRVYSDDDDEWMDFNGNVGMSTTVNIRYDRDELEQNREKFNVAYANYVTGGQLTSLLPLFGILGTVGGLIMSSGTTDLEQMVAGLGTAMWTTLWGLITSIILKAFDAMMLGRQVNLIDAKFAEADTMITRQTLQTELQHSKTRITQVKPKTTDGQQRAVVPVSGVQPKPANASSGSGTQAKPTNASTGSGAQTKPMTASSGSGTQSRPVSTSQQGESRNDVTSAAETGAKAQVGGPTKITKVQTKVK